MTEAVVTTGDESVLDAFYNPKAKLAIVACAGGNRNALTGGAFISLRRRRLGSRPDAFVGVSSGIATIGFLMGNGVAPDIKVFAQDMSDKRMFDLTRRFWGGHPFDVDYVERVFRGLENRRGIRAHEAIKHRAPLYAVLGHAQTGKPIIRKAEDAEDIWKLASYGAAVTGFARPLTYRGLPVTDGYFTKHNLPVEWLIAQEQPTDVLVFAGKDFDPKPRPSSWLEQALYRSGYARANSTVQDLIRTRDIRFMQTAERVVTLPRVRVLIVWMPEKLSPIKINEEKSRELVRVGYRTMEALFKRRRL